jgi:hypothetical protein
VEEAEAADWRGKVRVMEPLGVWLPAVMSPEGDAPENMTYQTPPTWLGLPSGRDLMVLTRAALVLPGKT